MLLPAGRRHPQLQHDCTLTFSTVYEAFNRLVGVLDWMDTMTESRPKQTKNRIARLIFSGSSRPPLQVPKLTNPDVGVTHIGTDIVVHWNENFVSFNSVFGHGLVQPTNLSGMSDEL